MPARAWAFRRRLQNAPSPLQPAAVQPANDRRVPTYFTEALAVGAIVCVLLFLVSTEPRRRARFP
jgi:hypothetical protein